MPIYEYHCDSCGHELEVMQKLADAPLTDCPECETSALRKKISAVGFRLKGSGWYETDFKSGNKKNLAEGGSSESKAEADSGTKSESKADTKTASKSESKSGDKPSSSGKSSTSNAAA
ncbi:MAG: zinc ribbon domain-containing protein [Gammaproteobacteria bacterium]